MGEVIDIAVNDEALRKLPPQNMRHNIYWTLAGNTIYTACQWGMLVAMAKLGTPEMVGVFGLALAVTAPVVMFFNLELRSVQATDAKLEFGFNSYLGLRIITSCLALAMIIAFAIIGKNSLQTALVIIAMGLAKGFESISDVLYGLFQNRERMNLMATSMMIKGFLGLTALVIVIFFTKNALCGVLALAAAWATMLGFYDLPRAAYIMKMEKAASGQPVNFRSLMRPVWNHKILAKLAWLSLPLGFMMMLVSLNVNIPRYFVQGYYGERQLGFFVAVAYLMVAISTVVTALGQAASPRLAQYYADGSNLPAFRKLLAKLVGAIVVLSGIAVLAVFFAGRQILTIIYKPEYANSADIFLLLMIASGIGGVGVILRYGTLSARQFKVQTPLWVLITGSSALACWLLIPKFGMRGAGMAMIISALVQVLGNLLILIYGDITSRKAIAGGSKF